MGKPARSFTMMAGMLSVMALVFTGMAATRVYAQNTCNAFVGVSHAPAGLTNVGDTRTITLTLGSGGVVGGSKVTINQVRYDLDCNGNFPVTVPCTDQGDIFNYQGDATITTNCGTCMVGDLNAGATCAPVGPGGGCDLTGIGANDGTCVAVTWTSNVPGGGNATNEIVFTPSTPIDIVPNDYPYCDFSFDVQLDNLEPFSGPNSDSTSDVVEVVAGFEGTDATCDNSLSSTGSQPDSIPLGPPPTCGNGTVDPGETCDPPASTPATPPGNTNLCRTNCLYCGDGIVNGPETCDTGGVFNRSCNPNCTGRLAKDPGAIAFGVGRTGNDRLQVNGLILPRAPIDPSTMVVGVRLSNANGVIFSTQLGAHTVRSAGRKFKYRNRFAKKTGGMTDFQFAPHKGGYRVKLTAFGDLSAATLADMTVQIFFGNGQYEHAGTWTKTRQGRGWRESDHSP